MGSSAVHTDAGSDLVERAPTPQAVTTNRGAAGLLLPAAQAMASGGKGRIASRHAPAMSPRRSAFRTLGKALASFPSNAPARARTQSRAWAVCSLISTSTHT